MKTAANLLMFAISSWALVAFMGLIAKAYYLLFMFGWGSI
jgi:hypothetical protein